MKPPLSMAGIFPPIPTPFDATGELDLKALAANLEKWNRYPLSGYVVLGTNGEFPYLTESEKLTYFEAARKHIPPTKLFMAGTACESTHSTIALTKKAAALGADVAILVTPSYYKSRMDAAGLSHYYLSVADVSPIPVSLYNMPANTTVDMPADLIIALSQHPNILGVKDSGGNLAKLGEIIRSARPGFQVLAGSAGFLYPALCVGAIGGVLALANIAPQQCCDIVSLFKHGKHEDARELQLRMIAPNTAVTARFGVPGLKAALDLLGYYGGPPRSPLLPLNDAQKDTLRSVLVGAGILGAGIGG
ncbi:MAG: dihydrodipicolinate synthase family protein [candidate division NC10 bacterium]|nr:dihydrodipicolinate synthase family protein [candidate division NC10 bacterium]